MHMKKNSIVKNISGVFLIGIIFMGCGCAMTDRAVSLPIGDSLSVSGEETQEGTELLPGKNDGHGGSEGKDRDAASSGGEDAYIYVHVCGAVAAPGVLKLPVGSRGADALILAGGFTEDALEDYINLAERLEDGQKLYFPTREEAELWQEEEEEARQEESALVNINTAEEARLCTLPGIGESRAKDIIAYREAHGSFAKTEDIMRVSGIKESVYRKISSLITVE